MSAVRARVVRARVGDWKRNKWGLCTDGGAHSADDALLLGRGVHDSPWLEHENGKSQHCM